MVDERSSSLGGSHGSNGNRADDFAGYQERYTAFVEQAADGIFVTDAAGTYLDVSEAGARMLGRTRGEIVGRHIGDLLQPDEAARARSELARVVGGHTHTGEWSMRAADGGIVHIELRAKLLSDGRVYGIVRDLTARKLADEALRQSEERFQALTAAAHEGIGITEAGKFVDLNEQLASMFGYERAELIDKPVSLLIAPESRQQVDAAIHGAEARAYEHRGVHKDGSSLLVDVSGRPMYIGGRLLRVTAVRDVSERDRVQRALEALVQATSNVGQPFFAALVQQTVRSLDVRCAFVAELLPEPGGRARIVALFADGAPGTVFDFALTGTPFAAVLDRSECTYVTQPVRRLALPVEFPDVAAHAYLAMPLRDASGTALGMLVALHDAELAHPTFANAILSVFAGRAGVEVQRMRADAALREGAERYRLLVESSSDLVVEMASNGTLSYLSPRFEATLGYRVADLLGRDALEHVHPEDRPAIRNQRTGLVTFRYRHHDGSERWLEATLGAYRTSTGEERAVIIARDVTGRRLAEQEKAELDAQRRQAQKLEALGTLAGGIAHDFNNILGAIFSYSELARMDASVPELVRAHVAELQRSASRARDLVTQILAFSRQQKQEHVPVELVPLLDEVLRFLRSTLPATIEIDAKIDRSTPLVLASAIQVHQVITNLCTNAEHAMRGKPGKLTITLECVAYDEHAARLFPELRPVAHARLSISDTGVGMDDVTLKHIFDPFFTTKDPGEGTGLGLPVVHGIVKEHGGALRVTSRPDEGSTFSVYLPTSALAQRPAVVSVPSEAVPVVGRILFVDDEVALCDSVRMLLERHGHHVTIQNDPLAALELFQERPEMFDLVITDLTMPRMTGLELARRMLRVQPNASILLTSGYSRTWTNEEVRALGLRGLLTKPVDPAALTRAVQDALRSA